MLEVASFPFKNELPRAPHGIVAHLTLVGKVGVFALCLSTLSRQAFLRNKNKNDKNELAI